MKDMSLLVVLLANARTGNLLKPGALKVTIYREVFKFKEVFLIVCSN